jgi:hypothetical protein
MAANISPQLQSLLASFCQSVGLDTNAEAVGIEFEAMGHIVAVSSDPRADDRLLAEVIVGGQTNWPAGLGDLLHRLNDAARLEHDWIATVGADGELRLHTQRRIAETGAGDLEALLADGLDRGLALAELTLAIADGSRSPGGADKPPGPPPGSMLRA